MQNGEAESEWSQLRTFTYTRLERTSQISPSTDIVLSDTSPIFEWTEIEGATYYIFQVRYLDDIVVANEFVKDGTYCVEEFAHGNCPRVF